jgi:hypothetical protein
MKIIIDACQLFTADWQPKADYIRGGLCIDINGNRVPFHLLYKPGIGANEPYVDQRFVDILVIPSGVTVGKSHTLAQQLNKFSPGNEVVFVDITSGLCGETMTKMTSNFDDVVEAILRRHFVPIHNENILAEKGIG